MSWSKGNKPGVVTVAMTVMVVLLVVPLFVLCTTPLYPAQQLNFWVLNTSVAEEQAKAKLSSRNTYFHVGQGLRMLCQYAHNNGTDYCSRRTLTNLTVVPSDPDISLVESHMIIVKTKCNLTLEMSNLTVDMAGRYTCLDTLNPDAPRQRRFQIGEKPEVPMNIDVVYRPNANLMVLLDPVRTGPDLNDNFTRWNVLYTWLDRSVKHRCSKRNSDSQCKHLTPEGLCRVCVVPLKNYECGIYRFGSIDLSINFNISVTNKFGTVPDTPLKLSVQLTEWVKPGPVSSVSVKTRTTTPSSLALSIASPKNIDQKHYTAMMSSTKFYLQYSVLLLSARDQSLMLSANRDFNQTYGFVRNLADEEEALRNSVGRSQFPYVSQWQQWNSSTNCTDCFSDVCNVPRTQRVMVPDLPFSGYHYNVSVNTKARYSGQPVVLRPAKAKTRDSAPLEGPGLHDNFAHCLSPSPDQCVTCFIYFKEIPQVKRGGEVIRHTLTLNLTDRISNELPDSCQNWEGVTLHTGGQNNTFHVAQLAVGGVYSVEVIAYTRVGFRSTTDLLRVTSTPPSFAPRNVVVEKSDVSYDVTWEEGNGTRDVNMTYFAHYCYTIPVQLDLSTNSSHNGSMQAPLPLNCVTNMVTKVVDKTSKGFASFDQVLPYRDLTPTFFVSAVGPGGVTSGLQSVDCFYARGRYPSAVDAYSIQAYDPQSLVVRFPLPCGGQLTYKGGRPQFYRLALLPDSAQCGDHDCTALLHTQGTLTEPMRIGPRDVEYRWRHLEPETGYWVGVNTARHDNDFLSSSWRWQHAITAQADSGWMWWVILIIGSIVLLVLVFVVFTAYKVRTRVKQCESRFKTYSELFKQDHVMSGMSVAERGWGEGTVNPNYETDSLRPLNSNYPCHVEVGVYPSTSSSLITSSGEGETVSGESGSSDIRQPSPCTASHQDNNTSDLVITSFMDDSTLDKPVQPPPVISRYNSGSRLPPKHSTLSPIPGTMTDTEDDDEDFEDEVCDDDNEECDDDDEHCDDEDDGKRDDIGANDSADDKGEVECDEKAGLIPGSQVGGLADPKLCFSTLTFPSMQESPMDIASILSAAGAVRSVTPDTAPVLSPSISEVSESCCQSATSETPLLSPNHTPSHALSPLHSPFHALPLLHTPSPALPPLNTLSSPCRALKTLPNADRLPPVASGSESVSDSSRSSKSPATLAISSTAQVTRNNTEQNTMPPASPAQVMGKSSVHDTLSDKTVPASVTNGSRNPQLTGKCSENGPSSGLSVPPVLPVTVTNVSSSTQIPGKCSVMGELQAVNDSPPDLSISAILLASKTSSVPQLTPSTGQDVSKRQFMVHGDHGDHSGLNSASSAGRQAAGGSQSAVSEVFSGALRQAETLTDKTSRDITSREEAESTGRVHHNPCSSLSSVSLDNNSNKSDIIHSASPSTNANNSNSGLVQSGLVQSGLVHSGLRDTTTNNSNFTVKPVSSDKDNISNMVQPVLLECIPPLDTILRAAEECPWRNDGCEAGGSQSSLQHQLSDSDRSSQWRASGHESGFDTDLESGSSTEGEGGSCDSRADHNNRGPDLKHHDPELKCGHEEGVTSHTPRLKDGRSHHVGKTVIQDTVSVGGRCVCDKDPSNRGVVGRGGDLKNGGDLPLLLQTPPYSRVTCDTPGDVVSTRL